MKLKRKHALLGLGMLCVLAGVLASWWLGRSGALGEPMADRDSAVTRDSRIELRLDDVTRVAARSSIDEHDVGERSGMLSITSDGCRDPHLGKLRLVWKGQDLPPVDSITEGVEASLAGSIRRIRHGSIKGDAGWLEDRATDGRVVAKCWVEARSAGQASQSAVLQYPLPWRTGVRMLDGVGRPIPSSEAAAIARQYGLYVLPFDTFTEAPAVVGFGENEGTVLGAKGACELLGASTRHRVLRESGCVFEVAVFKCPPVEFALKCGEVVLATEHVSAVTGVVDLPLDAAALPNLLGSVVGHVVSDSGPLSYMPGAGLAIGREGARSSRVLHPWTSEGAFLFERLVPGCAWLFVERPGYVRRAVELDVPYGARLDIGTIVMQRGASLAGHVRDSDGNPVNAKVVAFTTDADGRIAFVGSGPDTSPDPGTGAYYILDLPLARVNVALADGRFAVNVIPVDIVSHEQHAVDLIAHAGRRVTLRLGDATLAAAHVAIRDSQGVTLVSTVIGQSGPTVVRLLPGSYEVVVRAHVGQNPSIQLLQVEGHDAEVAIGTPR